MAEPLRISEITIGTSLPFGTPVAHPNGTPGYFHLGNPVVNDAGVVIGFVVTFVPDMATGSVTPDADQQHTIE